MKKRNLITISLVLILVLFLVGCNIPKTGKAGELPSVEPTTEPTTTPTIVPTTAPSGTTSDPNGLSNGGEGVDSTADNIKLSTTGITMAPAVVLPPNILPPKCPDDSNCLCYLPMGRVAISYNPKTNDQCGVPPEDPCKGKVTICNDGSIRRPCDPPCSNQLPPIPRACIFKICPCGQDSTTCECKDCPGQPKPPINENEWLVTNQGWVQPNPYDNNKYTVPPPPPSAQKCGGKYYRERPCKVGETPKQDPLNPCKIICVPDAAGTIEGCKGKFQLCSDGSRAFLDPVTCKSQCPPGLRKPEPRVCEKPLGLGVCKYNDGSVVYRYWDYKTCNWIPPKCPPKSTKYTPPGCIVPMGPCRDGTWIPVDQKTCQPKCPPPRQDECPIWFATNMDLYNRAYLDRLPNGCFKPIYLAG